MLKVDYTLKLLDRVKHETDKMQALVDLWDLQASQTIRCWVWWHTTYRSFFGTGEARGLLIVQGQPRLHK